jgi:hypothetical protein
VREGRIGFLIMPKVDYVDFQASSFNEQAITIESLRFAIYEVALPDGRASDTCPTVIASALWFRSKRRPNL